MTKKKLLYVDDEFINLQLLQINLQKNYEVHLAEDALKGLEILDSSPDINIIISDMKMPYMNGVEFISRAKKIYPNKNFYLLTGYELTQEIQDAINNNIITKYFRKPFNIKEIEREIIND